MVVGVQHGPVRPSDPTHSCACAGAAKKKRRDPPSVFLRGLPGAATEAAVEERFAEFGAALQKRYGKAKKKSGAPGAGGEYKQVRGFDAEPTMSAHFIKDERLADAIRYTLKLWDGLTLFLGLARPLLFLLRVELFELLHALRRQGLADLEERELVVVRERHAGAALERVDLVAVDLADVQRAVTDAR